MVLTSSDRFFATQARHHPGEFSYAGDEHVFIAVDTTVGVQLTQGVGESVTTGFTSPVAIDFVPPEVRPAGATTDAGACALTGRRRAAAR